MSSFSLIGVLALATLAFAGQVLILETTVSGGLGSVEAQAAVTAGHTPVLVSPSQWSSMTTSDFSSYTAIVFGDATCSSNIGYALGAAEANKDVWSAAVTGNVIVDGTDPVFHSRTLLSQNAVAFAAAESGTGLYASLSCYYHDTAPGTFVSVLSGIGSFSVRGVGCYNDVHKVADHPALAGLTDEYLSNWFCSVHEAFDMYPSTFLPLAIANGVFGEGSVTFADNSVGVPFIVARGKTLVPVACGNGILESGEQCDDGNILNDDGCSAQCNVEKVVVDITCPSAQLLSASTSTCSATLDVSALVTVSDGATVAWSPVGPYAVGTTTVTATAEKDGVEKSCTFDVTVHDMTPPSIGAVTVDTTGLWPPNHKMVLVTLGYTPVDNCGSGALTCSLVNPISSETVDGLGDGKTSADITVSDATHVLARSERSGKGSGRAYGVTVQCTDGAGNVASSAVTIIGVPKSKGG